jgi:hypothetical protein
MLMDGSFISGLLLFILAKLKDILCISLAVRLPLALKDGNIGLFFMSKSPWLTTLIMNYDNNIRT